MTADVYATVDEALLRVLLTPADFRSADKTADAITALTAAAISALAGMGDVTDEQIKALVTQTVIDADEQGLSDDEWGESLLAAVRALIAQARATDQARIAELAAPSDWAGDLVRALNRAEAAEATVERVRVLCDSMIDGSGLVPLVRRALSGEDA